MVEEEATVGISEVKEMADAVVDVGFDGDQAGGEVSVLTLPLDKQKVGAEQGFEKVWHGFAVLRAAVTGASCRGRGGLGGGRGICRVRSSSKSTG